MVDWYRILLRELDINYSILLFSKGAQVGEGFHYLHGRVTIVKNLKLFSGVASIRSGFLPTTLCLYVLRFDSSHSPLIYVDAIL